MSTNALRTGVVTLLLALAACAPAGAMTVDEAIKVFQTPNLAKDATRRNEAVAVFQNLAPEQRDAALEKLLPLLGLSGPERTRGIYPTALAFVALGEPALRALVEKLPEDTQWPNLEYILPRFGAAAAAPLAKRLSDPNPKVRQRAAELLGHRGILRGASPGALLAATDDKAPTVRRAAAYALVGFGKEAEPVVAGLVERAKAAPDKTVRIFCVQALGNVGPAAAPAAGTLAGLLSEADLSLRAATTDALGAIGPDAATAVPALKARLLDADEDLYVRGLAAIALGRIGEAGVPVLIEALNGPNELVAYDAARGLAASGETAVPALGEALSDANPQRRRFAAFALGKIGAPAAPALDAVRTAADDTQAAVRRNALEALARIEGEKALPQLTAALNDRNAGVGRAAAAMVEAVCKDATQADDLLADYRARTAWKAPAGDEPTFDLPETEPTEIGGPLAGVKLPPFPTQHGEEPGYPGCIPALQGEESLDMGNTYYEFGAQGVAPERQLYAGAVEHWRAYMFKYLPVRSFFDKQSQLKNWAAPDLPGAPKARVEDYAEPVYWVPRHAAPRPTGRHMKPVPVVRCAVKAPVITLDLGTLDAGVYTVRLVGAVEEKVGRFLKPLYVRMNVNDRPGGGTGTHRVRCGYVDQFYSVAELYFHAPEKRAYTAEIFVDDGSTVDLLVHTISLDDALAGTVRAPIKRRPVHVSAPERVQFKSRYLTEERLARDAAIWRGMHQPNVQSSDGYWPTAGHFQSPENVARFGWNGTPASELAEAHGTWQSPSRTINADWGRVFLVNNELGPVYTRDQLARREPLPDPYPFKDDGAGVYKPDPENPDQGDVMVPVGGPAYLRRRWYGSGYLRGAEQWVKTGDTDAARDAALILARIAYRCPTIDSANNLDAVTCNPAAYGRDLSCRRRITMATWLSHYPNYLQPPTAYDQLFTYIDGNEELAASVGRFVPWVKTSKDLVELFDVYLVQTIAKRILRYHYHTGPMEAAEAALILNNRSVAEPWIDWVFSRTFVYPLAPAGIQNLMISGCDRCGPEYVGSTYYSQGEGAQRVAASLEKFRRQGMLPERYDLTRTDRYPKPLAHCYWRFANIVAGKDFFRIGDVCGADKVPGHTLRTIGDIGPSGWRWSKDPKFAWICKHVTGREGSGFDDAQWAAVERAAATVDRAPWLSNTSRQVYNWAGVLETGHEHTDWRFRRAVYVRTGLGIGHHHDDSLDLHVVAHGLPMTVDGGQRPGYSSPGDRTTRVHNLVEVNGSGHRMQSWVRSLGDAAGARYLQTEAVPPNGATLYRRQVALIDVDEGEGSQPVDTAAQAGIGGKLPDGVTTANSYVFDVFRVSGGNLHTYCFHGPVSDQVKTNAALAPVPVPAKDEEMTADQHYLRYFSLVKDERFAGDAPDTLEATWRYLRGPVHGSEDRMAQPNFREDSPRKFTRLHLLGADGLRVLRGTGVCRRLQYNLHHLYAQKRGAEGDNLETAYVALIEPYVATPFIAERRLLAINDNETDARRAVAAEVKTVNGHTDLLFADGRPDKVRSIHNARFAAEFAAVSRDADGLRVATLTGGTRLETDLIRLAAAERARTGKVTAVDYLKRAITIDTPWAPASAGRVFEIGTPQRTTSYTLASVAPQGQGSVLTVTHGADYYRSVIHQADPAGGTVTCQIKPALGKMAGLDEDFTASNDAMTKFWRADYLDNKAWRLRGDDFTKEDFGPSGALRVWEYGVGDTVRLSTHAAVRRTGDGVFEVTGDVDVTLALPAAALEVSADGTAWTRAKGTSANGWFETSIALEQSGKAWVRVK